MATALSTLRRLIFAVVVVAIVGAACGDSAAGADPERFCALDVELDQYFGAFETSPSDARAAARQVRDLLDESVEVAPDDIRPSVESARVSYFRFLDVLELVDFDVAQADQVELGAIFEDETWQAAGHTIEAWLMANCSP